jgi:hypothetical protein
MVSEIFGFIFRNYVVETLGQEWQEPVVFLNDTDSQCTPFP